MNIINATDRLIITSNLKKSASSSKFSIPKFEKLAGEVKELLTKEHERSNSLSGE